MPTHRIIPALAALLATVATAATARAQSIERHQNTPPSIILQSVTVPAGSTMLYLSGQVPLPIDTTLRTPTDQRTAADYGDTKTQTISTLHKVRRILESRGYTMRDVIKMTVYLVGDPKLGGRMDFAGMNEAFRQFFGSADNPDTVARTTVQVAALAGPGLLVEIEAVAARAPSR